MKFGKLLLPILLVGVSACSQEAPQGKSAVGNGKAALLNNPGFEAPGDKPEGWRLTQHAGPASYENKLDDAVSAEGKRSFRLKRTKQQVYGLIDQRVGLPPSGAKQLKLAAKLRTQGVGPGGWILTVNFLDIDGQVIDQRRAEAVTGDTDWLPRTIEAPIPANTSRIAVGAMLLDDGTGWLDDVQLELTGD